MMPRWVLVRRSVQPPPYKKKPETGSCLGLLINPGGDLLSHTVTRAVPSAVEGLTTVFGMGTGVTPLLSPPETWGSSLRSTASVKERKSRCQTPDIRRASGRQLNTLQTVVSPPTTTHSAKENNGQASRLISTS